jgi:alpha-beta hydrolase superfamily lysophospholipase
MMRTSRARNDIEALSVSDYIEATDGVRLHYRHWRARAQHQAVLLYLHGIASHSDWFAETAPVLAAQGVSVYAPDRRGSGLSEGQRGHLARYERALLDIDEIVRFVRSANVGRPLFLAGSSWGAKVAVVYAAARAEFLSGLLLLGPGLMPRVNLPLWRRLQVIAGHTLTPTARIPIPLTPELYTRNPAYLEYIRSDELRLLTATSRFFWETSRLDRSRRSASERLRVPLLIVQGEDDAMMNVPKTTAWFSRLRDEDKTYVGYPGAGHTLEFESDRTRYVGDLAGWMLDRSSSRPSESGDSR